jgi:hypothetical protein|nr:DUF262 domain-containing protein [uncultured Porphyromonas sp.]
MTANNSATGEAGVRLSFYQLLTERDYIIQIPIIQRDYTQGRDRYQQVRDTFLDTLASYLEEGLPHRDLDFVYGSSRRIGDVTYFIPLDGQQRLTTLFLLHWYLAQITPDQDLRDRFLTALHREDGAARFTYETRSSSREFCDLLIRPEYSLREALHPISEPIQGRRISRLIEDASWFLRSWKLDPTIQAMLQMLDAIDRKFWDKEEYLELLLNVESPVITMLYLDLEEFKLTDDLYIKMNARGKQLTPFENFKAQYEDYLGRVHPDYRMDFERKIDTKWADLFWNYRGMDGNDTYDDELSNFIRAIFSGAYAERKDLSNKDIEETLRELISANKSIPFSVYKESVLVEGETASDTLIKALDTLSNGDKKIKEYLSKEDRPYYKEYEVFENVLRDSITSYSERISFYAYIHYLIRYGTSAPEGLHDWMRLMSNLYHQENIPFDSLPHFIAAVKSVQELLPYADKIIDYLSSEKKIPSYSFRWQEREELVKARLIKRSPQWRTLIESTEKNPYFTGQIGFLLDFVGIYTYYEEHTTSCDWTEEQDQAYQRKFNCYAEAAKAIFSQSYADRTKPADYLFERAVLSKGGKYPIWGTAWRRNLLSTCEAGGNIRRDFSWKRLFRVVPSEGQDEEDKNKEGRKEVQAVLDDPLFQIENIEDSLREICTQCPKTGWYYPLVVSKELVKYCSKGFITFYLAGDNSSDLKDHQIFLLRTTQMNGKHVELYSYYIYRHILERKDCQYRDQTSTGSLCEVELGIEKREKHVLTLFFDAQEGHYTLSIEYRKRVDSHPSHSPLQTQLEEMGFSWCDKYSRYHMPYPEPGALGTDGTLPERVARWLIELRDKIRSLEKG